MKVMVPSLEVLTLNPKVLRLMALSSNVSVNVGSTSLMYRYLAIQIRVVIPRSTMLILCCLRMLAPMSLPAR